MADNFTTEVADNYSSTESPGVSTVAPDDDRTVQKLLVSAVLTLVLCATVALNVLLLVVWCRSARLRGRPHLYFWVCLAVVDLVAAVFCLLPSLTAAAGWSWVLGGDFCTFQGVVSTWCYCMTTTTFMVMGVESFLKVAYPSKHPQAFYKWTVIILLVTVGLYSGVIALFPIMSWGELQYIRQEAQCHFLFHRSVSHLSFMFAVTFCFPLLLTCAFYTASQIKVWYRRRRQAGTAGKLVLEEDKDVPKQSYGQMLKKMEAQYKSGTLKKSKPRLARETGWEAQQSGETPPEDASSSSEVEDDEVATVTDYAEGRAKKLEQERRKKRVYHLRRRDIRRALVGFITTQLYLAVWLPFWLVTFFWVYEDVDEGIHTAVTVITYLGLFYKPLVYLVHRPFRQAAADTLCGHRGQTGQSAGQHPPYVEQVNEHKQPADNTEASNE